MKKNQVKLTKKELEVFSDELLSDFQMMEVYAGAENDGCGSGGQYSEDKGCNAGNCGCIFFFCGDDCKVKMWFNCHDK